MPETKNEITRRDIAVGSGLASLAAGLIGRIIGDRTSDRGAIATNLTATAIAVPGVVYTIAEFLDQEELGDPDEFIQSMSRRGVLGLGLISTGLCLRGGLVSFRER